MNKYAGSYSYNGLGASTLRDNPASYYVLGLGEEQLMLPAVSEAQVSAPSKMIAITDAASGLGYYVGPTFEGDDINTVWPSTTTEDPFRHIIQNPPQHGMNFNVLFCDGHVSAMKVRDLMSCSNSASLWNYDHQSHPEGWRSPPWSGP